MADIAGTADLLNALGGSPGLGKGLKPSAKTTTDKGAARAAAFFAAAANGTANTASVGGTTATASPAAATAIRVTRAPSSAAKSYGAPARTVIAEGQSYDAKAPRGTYVDVLI